MAKILIVEDDDKLARAIARELTAEGHSCALRNKARGTLELARKERPDLLVLDIMMPDMSGFEVCRLFRRDEELYTLPILILSAMNDQEEVRHGFAQGADEYVTKPFDMRHLVQRIDALVAASSTVTYVDGLTSLPDAAGTRRELQRLISRGAPFALVYVELLNLRDFGQRASAAERDKATRHLARALEFCGKETGLESFFAGHMGGGHFMCIVPIDEAEDYCKQVQEAWDSHRETLYGALSQVSREIDTDSEAADPPPLLELLFSVTKRESKDTATSQQLLDVVSRIRNMSVKSARGGIHMDRRS